MCYSTLRTLNSMFLCSDMGICLSGRCSGLYFRASPSVCLLRCIGHGWLSPRRTIAWSTQINAIEQQLRHGMVIRPTGTKPHCEFDIEKYKTFTHSFSHLFSVNFITRYGKSHINDTYFLIYSMEQSPSWEANWFCS